MDLKNNKKLKRLIIISIVILACLVLLTSISFADVGSFESYSSGRSSSRSSGGSYSGSGGSSFFFISSPVGLVIFIIIIIIIEVLKRKGKINMPSYDANQNASTSSRKTEDQIVSEIQAHDELFNKDEIIAWSKDLFVRLQQAWSKCDWSEIRVFETNTLFEQHKNQLQGYIDNNQINVMDRICVNYANLYDYRVSGDKELLVIKLNSRMQDYIIDATTKKVLRGDPNIERTHSYLLTFERKMGVKTKPGTTQVNTTNCPNCGAPTQITSAGKCEYCGSVITTGEYNWCLSNLERAQY